MELRGGSAGIQRVKLKLHSAQFMPKVAITRELNITGMACGRWAPVMSNAR